MAYCTYDDVRHIAPLSRDEIDESDLTRIYIPYATSILNAEITLEKEDEKIEYINKEKENDVDGSNTTFYTKIWPIGDTNDDGTIDGSDVYFYELDTDGVRTEFTVSSVTAKIGKFVLATAPTSANEQYISYKYSLIDTYTPHPLVKLACAQLAAALAYSKLEGEDLKNVNILNLRMSFARSYDKYMADYQKTLQKIRRRMVQERKYN